MLAHFSYGSRYGIEFLRRLPTDLAVPGAELPDIQFKEQVNEVQEHVAGL